MHIQAEGREVGGQGVGLVLVDAILELDPGKGKVEAYNKQQRRNISPPEGPTITNTLLFLICRQTYATEHLTITTRRVYRLSPGDRAGVVVVHLVT